MGQNDIKARCVYLLFKKEKTSNLLIASSNGNTSGILGEREISAVETRAIGKCLHSFFDFSKSFTSVSYLKQLDYELKISIA